MPQTSLDIANSALVKIGEPVIVSFADGTKTSDVLQVRFPQCRNMMLRSHLWRFAKKVAVNMSPLVETPPQPWNFSFQLPSDFGRIITISAFQNTTELCNDFPYELAADRIWTAVNPITLRYVMSFGGASDGFGYPDDFAETLACYLAADLAPLITQNAAGGDRLMQQYSDNLRLARFNGAVENYPIALEASEWIEAHGGLYVDIGARALAPH